MTQQKPLLTRKDIAMAIVDCTPQMVAANEKRWGIDKYRNDLNRRCVRYRANPTWMILRAKGYIV